MDVLALEFVNKYKTDWSPSAAPSAVLLVVKCALDVCPNATSHNHLQPRVDCATWLQAT